MIKLTFEFHLGLRDSVGAQQDSNLVDPASSHMLVSRLSHACLSINEYTVKLRTAHSNSYRLFDISDSSNMDTRSNSRANTCVTGDFTEPQYY